MVSRVAGIALTTASTQTGFSARAPKPAGYAGRWAGKHELTEDTNKREVKHNGKGDSKRSVMARVRLNYPPPANEQDFEELCLQLLRVHCDRPHLELYAQRGESQAGVDIFDPIGQPPTVAAQCKLYKASKGIPPAHLRSEVQKAKAFEPTPDQYVILTTAKRTSAAQKAVLAMNIEHRAQGLFTVELMTWERINELLHQHPSVAGLFYKTLASESAVRIEGELTSLRKSIEIIQKALQDSPADLAVASPSNHDACKPSVAGHSMVEPLGNASDFKKMTETLLSMIRRDARVEPILNGVHIPIYLPKIKIEDYSLLIEDLLLPALKKSYETTFIGRSFVNSMSGKLRGQLAYARDSRQEQLIERMAAGPVYGILFPVALQGFSVLAAREQMASLPEGFVLSGVLDSCIAMTEYADVLARDANVPTLVCGGTTWQGNLALCFHPSDKGLQFCVADEAFAIGSFSPGLLYVG